MAILVLGKRYVHATIMSVKSNSSIEKAFGKGTFIGTRINYEEKNGELSSEKINQGWLDNDYQAELKASIMALKPGDEVTLYKEKTIDEAAYNGIDDPEQKKKAGHWGVKKIYQGHIQPDGCLTASPSKTSFTGGASGGTGMHIGHAIKGATQLCIRQRKAYVEAAKEVYDVTKKLTQEYSSLSGGGSTVGNAVLNACFLVPTKKVSVGDLETTTRKILDLYLPEITAYVAEQEAPPVPVEASSNSEDSAPVVDFDDDIPF